MTDHVLHDSPTEFLHEAAQHGGRCVAQSVVPTRDGGYLCACSCGKWEVVVDGREEGLEAARRHTGSI